MSSQVEKDPEVLDAATNKEDHIEAESSSTTQRDESAYENDVQEKAQENTQEPVAKIDSNAEEERVYVTGLPMMLLMTSLTMVVFLMLLDVSIIVTAIPRITTTFHSLPDVGWYGSAYQLASAALQPLAGKFYTYFKTKWVFLIFLFIFELGSLLCGVATSSNMLIVGRAVAGLGSSGLMNGAITIIALSAPLEKRPSLIGICMGFSQLGVVGGPLIGGALTQYTTWRWCFYINLPIGAVAAALILVTRIPDGRVKVENSLLRTLYHRLDLTGFIIFAPAAIMILLAVQWGGDQYAWSSSVVIGLLVGGGVTAIIFALWERRVGKEAMIPWHIVGKRQIWTSCLAMAFLFWSVLISSYYLPIYFQTVRNKSPFTSGVNTLPSLISQLVFAVGGGFLTQKVGYYLPFAVVSGAVMAVGAGLLSTISPHTSTVKWAAYQVVLGAGRGLGMQIPMLAVQANCKPSETAVATAVLVFSQTFGGALVLAIANAVFDNKLHSELNAHVPPRIVEAVLAAGARGVRTVTPTVDLPAVVSAYAKGVDSAFYIAVAGGAAMCFVSFGIGWKDLRAKKKPAAGEA